MKILLVAINAKYIHSNLAVYSLRTFASKYRDNIGIVEYTINNQMEDIMKKIYLEKADVVAFSCYIWNIDIVLRVSKELNKILPDVKIWLGGPEVSYNPIEYLKKNPQLYGIVVGEGEQTFLELSEYYLEHGKDLSKICGIVYRENLVSNDINKESEKFHVSGPRKQLSLDSIPFPYEDMEVFKNKIIYYESSRGCPFSCSYCLSSIEKGIRLRSIELVKKELKVFLDYGVPQIKFVDRTFNCNKKHAMDIWQFIKDNDNGITNFHFEISADLLSQEELKLLATLRPGQVQFEIGVQTTNPDTIKAIQRNMNLEKLFHNVELIRKAKNIHQHLDLIAGLPFEGYDSFKTSFNDVYLQEPDQLQLGFLKVLNGSLIDVESEQYGIVYQEKAPYEVLFTNHLSFSELLKLKGVCEMVEAYYNSGQFKYSIKYLEHFFQTPFDLYSELSGYYTDNKLDEVAHTKLRRYEILLDFLSEKMLQLSIKNKTTLAVFSEILLLDLCLRENIKSRPKFVSSPLLSYQEIRAICEAQGLDRKNIRVEQFAYDVITSAYEGKAIQKDTTILFDYSLRDPLSYGAKITVIEK
ncbi:B12-binding domain-containing radical SAM protein [Mobilitalea sibirica]|uniref:B12-binding domain-containing radical SAM protein n=1 Tax=Mobilitalea sibirica TaxID=1462919 RepID=A0A8J7H932_9FIRM|nr:B12-binding domain-containing radical SAM protein [Mobilitalea sibirica]MBH1940745.1 B12-binding domain-containing radical SAM protein [Mobilitalea sibirica]